MYTLTSTFPIDTNNPCECEWLEWIQHAPPADIKQSSVIGYVMMKHGFDRIAQSRKRAVNQDERQELEAALDRKHQLELSYLQTRIDHISTEKQSIEESLKQKHQLELSFLKAQVEDNPQLRLLHDTISQLRLDIQRRDDEIKRLNKSLIDHLQEQNIAHLRNEIHQRDLQIASLKNTNHSKGIQGENRVHAIMQHTFPTCAVSNTTKTAQESDIHVTDLITGNTIIIECKYKQTITPQDVDKSIRDIHHLNERLGNKLKAYVFYSLRTSNIPRKGHTFEIIDGIPVVWFGTNIDQDPHADARISEAARIANMMGDTVRAIQTTQHHDLKDLTDFLARISENINQNQKTIQQLQDTAQAMVNQTRTLQNTNHNLVTIVASYLKEHALTLPPSSSASAPAVHKCPGCGKEFKRKCDLTKHQCQSTS